VIWLPTATGKQMICDDPNRDGKPRRFEGTVERSVRVFTAEGRILALKPGEEAEGWAPHWGSCPQAKDWRKKA